MQRKSMKESRLEHMKDMQNQISHQMAMSNSSLNYDPNADDGPLKSAASTLLHVLDHHKASDCPCSGKPVVEVEAAMTPLESAKILWHHNILGAPVWDATHQKYVGFFDMRDLLSTVLVGRQRVIQQDDDSPLLVDQWFLKDVGELPFTTSYLAARNPFVAKYTNDTTLLEVSKALIEKSCHRIPLIDPATGRCTRILSQSALVKFLAEHVPNHHPALEIKLKESNFPYRKVVLAAPDTSSAKEVFTLMDQHRLSGIAIVDAEDGKLVGNTSATDIKVAVSVEEGVCADMDKLDIVSYLAAVRQEQMAIHDRYPSSHVAENSTIGHAVKLLAKTSYHRLFVVDETTHKPVGVMSVTDVVRFVVEQGEKDDSESGGMSS